MAAQWQQERAATYAVLGPSGPSRRRPTNRRRFVAADFGAPGPQYASGSHLPRLGNTPDEAPVGGSPRCTTAYAWMPVDLFVSSAKRAAWGGRLVLAPGLFLYIGSGASADIHAHHAVQFVWSSAGAVKLRLANETIQATAFLVPAGVEHSFDASGHRIALMLVERHGARGAMIDQVARAHVGEDLSSRLVDVMFPSSDLGAEAALSWCESLLAALGCRELAAEPSSMCRRVVAFVESNLDGVPRLSDAAQLVGISTTRLTHLFSTEVGVPFRRYVLWARIKRAVEATRRGANATGAAVEAGFSDSAHLTRTFRAMFGLPPSFVLPLVEIVGSAWSRAS